MSSETTPSNRLAKEKSPYLLQHAHNPVDWFPWSQEAFDKAALEDKPIFLSVGYATCHWCHVMAHESFEDKEAAELINRVFIPVKVDREERPDVDAVYMKAAQIVSGRGGWPLTAFLTPQKEPFFLATYIPKKARFPQNGLMELIPKIERLWKDDRQKVRQSAEAILQALQNADGDTGGHFPDEALLKQAADDFRQRFDQVHGGFGQAPKFPSPHNLIFLLRYSRRTMDPEILKMATQTLRAMRLGGMFDHLGFGFHRYSTDKEWLVPHFEKMLYDQALLSLAYLEAFQTTGNSFYADTARETFSYVLHDLRTPEGVFCSGEDADSEGVEGKFYLWSESEIRSLLTQEEAELFIRAFGVKSAGNFKDEASGRLTGENILHRLTVSDAEMAEALNMDTDELREILRLAGHKLLEARKSRIRPQLDDKALTDWNGLMIAALAAGGKVLEDESYIEAAEQAADFLLDQLLDERGRLLHRYKDGESAISAFLDDYAFFIWGLIELHRSTGNEARLQSASRLAGQMIEHFWDAERGGFFLSADDGETVLLRLREIFDGALPSGNSAALNDLLELTFMDQNGTFKTKADELISAFSGLVSRHPSAFAWYLCGLDTALEGDTAGQNRKSSS